MGKAVIVRTQSAGVHFGYVVGRNGREITLERSRRVWYWTGANTCSELATTGLDIEGSKVADRITITLCEPIEIIDCTAEAVECFEAAKWRK